MTRAECVTIECHFHCSDGDGVRPFVVRHFEAKEDPTSIWFKFRRRTRVTKLISIAQERFNNLELWPHTISLELLRSGGGTMGIFGPGIPEPRFPLDIMSNEKLVLVARFD